MGSDAELFVFDAERFRSDVAPALVDLLTTGRPNALVRGVIARAGGGHREYYGEGFEELLRHLADHPFDFATLCTHLHSDFRSSDDSGWDRSWRTDWQGRACTSSSCPARTGCPLHRLQSEPGSDYYDNSLAEHMCRLFCVMVGDLCLGLRSSSADPSGSSRTRRPWPASVSARMTG